MDCLSQEVDALKETMAQLVAHNERLEKELGNSRQEAAQRDKLLEEMENVLHVRDDIIHAVHGASGSRVTAGFTGKRLQIARWCNARGAEVAGNGISIKEKRAKRKVPPFFRWWG